MSGEEFYVGYLPQAPRGFARHARRSAALLCALAVALAALVASAQRPFARARFEFGAPRAFAGVLRTAPVPHLEFARPHTPTLSRALLVAPFKHGAGPFVAASADARVRLQGTLIHRGQTTMIEIVPDSLERLADGPPPAAEEPLGTLTLRGEIVDSKCFLGVMKPGELKPHRACAALCIRGGIPPVLCVREEDGNAAYWLLVGPADEALNDAVLPFVAEPVEIRGEASRLGDWRILRCARADIRRR